jgi:hypothetical protein
MLTTESATTWLMEAISFFFSRSKQTMEVMRRGCDLDFDDHHAEFWRETEDNGRKSS